MGCLFIIGVALLAAGFTEWPQNFPGIIGGVLILWFVLDDFVPVRTKPYQKPIVRAARIRCANLYGRNVRIGELDVESSHSTHVAREMNLPTSSVINIVERNQSYTVQFELPAKMTPDAFEVNVYSPEGKMSRETITYTQQRADRDYVKDVARANGYQGRIDEQ